MLDREGGGVTQSAKANANSEKTAKKADFVNSNSILWQTDNRENRACLNVSNNSYFWSGTAKYC